MSSKVASSKKPVWEWWYKECWVQNVYIVLAVLSGILIVGAAILIGTAKIGVKNGDGKDQQRTEILKKYKSELALLFIAAFAITFAVDNLILVQYCNIRPKGVMNLVWSLILWFIVLPTVNSLIAYGLALVIVGPMLKDLWKLNSQN